jgi:fibro-slime domain-containing protein
MDVAVPPRFLKRLASIPELALLATVLVAGAAGSGCARVVGQEGEDAAAGFGGAGGAGGAGGGSAGTGNPFETDAAVDLAPPPKCGDGKIEGAEQCEDGNVVSGDGCSASCRIEDNFECPMLGKACVHVQICGDHRIDGAEACDDGNKTSGDGCTDDCKLECGWECPPMAACRAAKCGDGMVAGKERCDDGNTTAGDGCSDICLLESKPVGVAEGFVCTSPKAATGCTGPTTCTNSTCGNRMKEGSEQCDDGNALPGDGCSTFCRLEPICPAAGGACTTACGDGLLLAADKASGQECDDGDTIDGDGCSSKCKVEVGFTCKDVKTVPTQLVLPVVYRDFKGWNEGGLAAGAHPDFQHYPGNGQGQAGVVLPMLGGAQATGGVPVHVPMCMTLTANMCASSGADVATDWFGMWYVDNPTFNKTIVSTLTMMPMAGGAFQYSNDAFFPIDGMGWGPTPGQGTRNFAFTSVVRHWFEYSGTSSLSFYGDDDVWVFVNKKLAVDLGGTHIQKRGSITLDPADGSGYVCDFVAPGTGTNAMCDPLTKTGGHVVPLGLQMGNVYEIAVFHAERFTDQSNYQLTLSNLTSNKSTCESKCGDGVVTPPETCDLGAMNTGAYGGCRADCTPAPYCGDKIVQKPEEQCDTAGNCDKNCKLIIPP